MEESGSSRRCWPTLLLLLTPRNGQSNFSISCHIERKKVIACLVGRASEANGRSFAGTAAASTCLALWPAASSQRQPEGRGGGSFITEKWKLCARWKSYGGKQREQKICTRTQRKKTVCPTVLSHFRLLLGLGIFNRMAAAHVGAAPTRTHTILFFFSSPMCTVQ